VHQSIFQTLGKLAGRRLQGLADAAYRSQATQSNDWTITPEHLTNRKLAEALVEEIKKWRVKDQKSVYFIDVDTRIELSRIQLAFNDAKTKDKGSRAYCRLNGARHCLYVGRSDQLHTRVWQHLGYGHEKTYALQLSHWAHPLHLHFELHCAQYPRDTENDVLQAIEDQLWDEKKPMFGRRGPR
jgi:hypothetical protein